MNPLCDKFAAHLSRDIGQGDLSALFRWFATAGDRSLVRDGGIGAGGCEWSGRGWRGEGGLAGAGVANQSRGLCYFEGMGLVQVHLSEDLADAAQLSRSNPSADAARLLALELFREDKISLGRAAELCETPVEAFMEFAAELQVALHYGLTELEEDRQALQQLPLRRVRRKLRPHVLREELP